MSKNGRAAYVTGLIIWTWLCYFKNVPGFVDSFRSWMDKDINSILWRVASGSVIMLIGMKLFNRLVVPTPPLDTSARL